jgi:hypothetical protein
MSRSLMAVAALIALVLLSRAFAQPEPAPPVALPLISDGRPTQAPTTTPSASPTATATATVTSTPTATATATVTPIPDIPLPNGGFEDGREPWLFSDFGASRLQNGANGSGWYATVSSQFGGSIGQEQVTVPATHPYLSYYQQRVSFSISCDVESQLIVAGTVVDTWTFCQAQNAPTWARRTVDLSAYAGQTVSIAFTIEQSNNADPDDTDLDVWAIDEVMFRATP